MVAGGIGKGVAIRLAREGAKVVINYRSDPEGAKKAAAECEAFSGAGNAIERKKREGHMVSGPGAAKRESKASSYRRRARLHISFFRKLRRLAYRLQHQGDRPRNSLRVVSATTTTESEPTVVHVGPSEPRGRTLTQITGTETLYVSVRFVGP